MTNAPDILAQAHREMAYTAIIDAIQFALDCEQKHGCDRHAAISNVGPFVQTIAIFMEGGVFPPPQHPAL